MRVCMYLYIFVVCNTHCVRSGTCNIYKTCNFIYVYKYEHLFKPSGCKPLAWLNL